MGDKTDKNDPARFLGEGVSFRAKLIGVLEVPEARGDRMCQEALADLKMAIRAAGEHKQRIQVHVAIDGLRLRDDKTGDSLYHHPVHKISFIAQDMTDSRAFGYIFGSPDTGHRFFGIKTDKAASQVVIAMRDLFQVVFELKKKEIEMAKQQLEAEKIAIVLHKHLMPQAMTDRLHGLMKSVQVSAASKNKEAGAEGGVAELVDLEQELSSLRRGLTQVEELTPSADPFGDSFIAPSSKTQKALLPPPPSGSSTRGRNTPAAPRTVFSPNKQPSALPLSFDLAASSADFETPPTSLVDNINVPNEPAELKNPPKKVLKDLAQSLNTETEKDHYGPATTMTSLTRHSGGSVAIAKPQSQQGGVFRMGFFTSDPFAETDPFDNTDPFSDSFNDDPFTSVRIPELPLPEDMKDIGLKVTMVRESDKPLEEGKKAFNGPLQVSLPPEPAPKSPRLQRQSTDSGGGGTRKGRGGENGSPPPPLPPKKCVDISIARPPPRPPLDHDHDPDSDPAPPLPRPARKKEPMADRSIKPRLSSVATNSSEDEYLTPAPPPLPAARRFDITLSQLLTCSMDDLANRLRVPAATLSSMTLPQLTEYLRSYLAADNERAHIHIEPTHEKSKHPSISTIRPASPLSMDRQKPTSHPPKLSIPTSSEFKPQFEDNFTPPLDSSDSFVANFDDFDKKANSSYDRYAAFREIQEQELKAMSILDPLDEPKQDSDEKEELAAINILRAHFDDVEAKETSKSPLKSLDELTIDSFNMFRSSVSPKPSHTPIDAKIEDIKSVMKNLQIEKSRRSVSPRDNGHVEVKQEDNNDRYAALREITITEPPDEFESLPPEVPKERKKSDEKSDGFDNSDFFDCIDNSSLSFTHVEDAFRKSPVVKEKEDKIEEKKEIQVELTPVRELQPPPTRLSTGSISDVVSGSSPDTKDKGKVVGGGVVPGGVGVGAGGRWAVLGGAGGSGASSDSRESEPRPRARRARNLSPARRHHCTEHNISVQTSSSSRDVSPWDEDPPPVTRLPRPPSHHRDRDRESRHNSSGSRECLDSGSAREKDKTREKRDLRERDLSRDSRESCLDRRDSGRDSRESGRDRRDSGSGRDRRDSKERDHREHRRDRRSRERDTDTWDRDRTYSRDYRDSRSRERQNDYREKDRDRHRKPRHSYDEEEDYSDGCGSGRSGRSSSRDRWPEQRWRRDERNYGSLGWRETRRRAETRQRDATEEPRTYSTSLGWSSRRSAREERVERETRRRPRREEPRQRDYRFSNDFSPRDQTSPFDSEDPPGGKKTTRGYPAIPDCPRYTMYGGGVPAGGLGSVLHQMVNSRFAFDAEETPLPSTASPLSGSSVRARDGESPATRFRFDSDSISPRSMFEDDFTAITTPRGRTVSIAEEEECDVPPLRPKPPQQHKDIKKSESINIFTRESDPFEGDAFFACTGSDRAARRENWPGDFQGFDNT